MVSYLEDRQALVKDLKHLTNVCVSYAKPVVHWGFVPFIIVLGMTTTEPRPTFAQLLGPV